jgi:hypothetical protein
MVFSVKVVARGLRSMKEYKQADWEQVCDVSGWQGGLMG